MANSSQNMPTSPILASAPVALPISATIVAENDTPAIITIASDNRGAEFSIPRSAYTLQGFRAWAASEKFPERGQLTFSHEGLIVDMSPELLESHNYVKTDVGLVLAGLARQKKLGRYIGDRALYSNEVGGFSTEPDALLISGKSLKVGRCTLVESKRPGLTIEIQGAVDWVLEVVSPTSVNKDKNVLREGYFRAGVAEYWLIDALGEEIDFQILVPGVDGYVPAASQSNWRESPTFGCSFDLTMERDADGFIHYTLHVKE
jgi:Uma2 family endonuclease